MKVNNMASAAVSVGVFLLSLLMFPDTAPGGEFLIRSQYRMNPDAAWRKETVWRFAVKDASIAVTAEGATEATATLTYGDDGRLKEVVTALPGGHEKQFGGGLRSEDGSIFLSDGFPVPFDDLYPENVMEGDITLKKSAGGMRFSEKMRKKRVEMDERKALALGMVAPEMADGIKEKTLQMIVLEKNGVPLVSQLWCKDDSWWIFEETPLRKSWRISEPAAGGSGR